MRSALLECWDTSQPLEYAAIHLKDYSLKFFIGTKENSVPMISKTEKGVILIKIYLLKWEQLEDLLFIETGSWVDLSRAVEKTKKDFEFPLDGS